MVIFNSYVKLPEGYMGKKYWNIWEILGNIIYTWVKYGGNMGKMMIHSRFFRVGVVLFIAVSRYSCV